MQARWFQAHPGIKHWHVRVERSLRETRSVSNRFGYRRVYFDRVEGLLPEALAWIPQSTVAIVINEVWAYITSHFPWIEILLQVHDSLVGQFLTNRFEEAQRAVAEAGASVVIPYSNPLTIPLGMKISTKSWGDVE
jgi:DNA polymerase I-like protein with 3'-5' exonuclease and polymerase domains